MEISKESLFLAASKLGIPKTQVEALWTSLENQDTSSKNFSFPKLLFYFGAIIIISAMTWFMSLSWEWFGGGGIFLIAVAYGIFFTILGYKLWNKKEMRIPAGLFITIAVCMTPLAIYGLETYLNIWPEVPTNNYRDFFFNIRSSWIFMEIGTILAGLIALRFFPFPFITAPIFFAAWFLAMDTIPLLIGYDAWEKRDWITMVFGLILMFIAYVIDLKKKKDYAFWGYLFGTFAFWISFSSIIWNKSELLFFTYFLVNILLMILSILLKRRVLLVFGVIGAFVYFSHLAYDIFKDSILFPFVLSVIGLLIIYLGVLYQKNISWIEKRMFEIVPEWIRKLLPYTD